VNNTNNVQNSLFNICNSSPRTFVGQRILFQIAPSPFIPCRGPSPQQFSLPVFTIRNSLLLVACFLFAFAFCIPFDARHASRVIQFLRAPTKVSEGGFVVPCLHLYCFAFPSTLDIRNSVFDIQFALSRQTNCARCRCFSPATHLLHNEGGNSFRAPLKFSPIAALIGAGSFQS
jgi:hypothetical protein